MGKVLSFFACETKTQVYTNADLVNMIDALCEMDSDDQEEVDRIVHMAEAELALEAKYRMS